MDYRIEHDSLGEVPVPSDKYWGAQTERSRNNFKAGGLMPREIIHAFALLKKASALANSALQPQRMTKEKCFAITRVCDEILDGRLDAHFPLVVFQTGSGTQTNMNVNEVIANRGSELSGRVGFLHPNDDVNMSQSSNDTFPTAMHIAAALSVKNGLLPQIKHLCDVLRRLEDENRDAIKSGRTHLQDAVPIRFSQEIYGWRGMLEKDTEYISSALPAVYELAIGGTAVGTGINCPKGFDTLVAKELSRLTGIDFSAAENKFTALTSKNALVYLHGAIKALAADLMKIANDIRFLASGPRCGLGEITIPANEPGSSIMPAKVNPTQCEAVTMVSVQVIANDTAVAFASSQGNFELNVFMPVIADNFLSSVRLLSLVLPSFTDGCVSGIKANRDKMKENLGRSLMLVTVLSPYIGYERCAAVASLAHKNNISIKEACLSLGYLSEEEFDRIYHPEEFA